MVNWGINCSNGQNPENWTPYGRNTLMYVEEKRKDLANVRATGGFPIMDEKNRFRATQRAFSVIDARNRPAGEPVANPLSHYSC